MGLSIDRKKVIKGLECHAEVNCVECPYRDGWRTCNFGETLLADALILLKEQEPKTGYWVSINDGDIVTIDNDGFPERACFCSECKKYLIASDEYGVYGRYCPFCGAKMEGRWNRDDSD